MKQHRRAQTAALYLSGIAVYWHYFIGPGQEDEEVTSDGGGIERSLSEGNETHRREPDVVADTTGDITTEDVQPDDAMFIPLGWARQCPMTFYKGSDPEWQSFVKLAQDKEMSLFIRSMPPASAYKPVTV